MLPSGSTSKKIVSAAQVLASCLSAGYAQGLSTVARHWKVVKKVKGSVLTWSPTALTKDLNDSRPGTLSFITSIPMLKAGGRCKPGAMAMAIRLLSCVMLYAIGGFDG